jgi:P pilus assembly chaperone PapD
MFKHTTKYTFAALIAAALAVFGSLPASAGTFAIDPTRLTFSTMTSGDVVLTNVGEQPVRLSVRAYKWTQNGGSIEELQPTEDVVYYPQIFALPPGASQHVRVGVLAAPGSDEQAYRLIVSAAGKAGVNFLSRVDIPVLLGANGQTSAHPELGDLAVRGHSLDVELVDAGTLHVEQSHVTLTVFDAQRHSLWSGSKSAFYVLAHSRIHVPFAIPPAALRQARSVNATWHITGGGTFTRTYKLP